MPNEIYLLTHDGLSSMVSSRAATRVLDGALRSVGASAETVTTEQMAAMLLGPVLGELQTILPRDGLRRNLDGLVARLHRLAPVGAARGPEGKRASTRAAFQLEEAEDDRSAGAGPARAAVGVALASKAAATSAAAFELDEDTAGDDVVAPHGTVTSERLIAGATRPEPAAGLPEEDDLQPAELGALLDTDEAPREHDLADLERAVLAFAQLEHVKLVAALRRDGSVAASRGSGVDLGDLSRLGGMALKLLSRSGRLRSYYLGHTNGQLFLFPLGLDVLAVVGGPDLNLGAVFAALTALKEEL